MSEGLERIANRFPRLGLALARRLFKRVRRIDAGPGKGLWFDPGPASGGFVSGDYEAPVQDAVAGLVRQGMVFYDIGANVGFFSVLAAKLVGPAGAVYAFEPVPENASLVERNARLNALGNISVFEVAVSDQTGRSELLLARYAGGAVLKSAGTPPDLSGCISVETATIDDLVKRQELRPPDIVKIDVEGAERNVLQGMVDTLRRRGPTVVMEFDDAVEAKCLEKMGACRKLLETVQYETTVLPNSYRDGNWFVRHLVAQRPRSGGK